MAVVWVLMSVMTVSLCMAAKRGDQVRFTVTMPEERPAARTTDDLGFVADIAAPPKPARPGAERAAAPAPLSALVM